MGEWPQGALPAREGREREAEERSPHLLGVLWLLQDAALVQYHLVAGHQQPRAAAAGGLQLGDHGGGLGVGEAEDEGLGVGVADRLLVNVGLGDFVGEAVLRRQLVHDACRPGAGSEEGSWSREGSFFWWPAKR